jgi:hypothetical protein
MQNKQHLIGKKVILLTPDLKKILGVGVLFFLGENKPLNWKLQATINRTPYTLKHLGQVIEWSEEKVREIREVKFKK